MNRRTVLKQSLMLGGLAVVAPSCRRSMGSVVRQQQRFRIGACDWSINAAASLRAFNTAKQIGLDGVQVSLNSLTDKTYLRDPAMQRQYLDMARQTGVAISGLAIGTLNNVPYKSVARTEQWVYDCIDVAKALGVTNVLLPFFGKNDLRNDPPGTRVVIDRLKAVAPRAEKAGVVLGLETWLSAPELLTILNAVGSPAVQVYYDVCNAYDRGYDIHQEMRDLGRAHICEIHLKENGYLIGQGKINLKEVRQTLDVIGYRGWLQLEGAVPLGNPMLESYGQNLNIARQVFN